MFATKTSHPGWRLQAAFSFHVFKSHYLELQQVSWVLPLLKTTNAAHKAFWVNLLRLKPTIVVQQHVKTSFKGRADLSLVENIPVGTVSFRCQHILNLRKIQGHQQNWLAPLKETKRKEKEREKSSFTDTHRPPCHFMARYNNSINSTTSGSLWHLAGTLKH